MLQQSTATQEREVRPLDFAHKARIFYDSVNVPQLKTHAEKLGLTALALDQLRIGWDSEAGAWTFPMRAADRTVIGIRYRENKDEGANKWAAVGSKRGLFVPYALRVPATVFVCEGPTDTAALISRGFYAIGRADAGSCEELARDFLLVSAPNNTRVVIVADNDTRKKGEIGSTGELSAIKTRQIIGAEFTTQIFTPMLKDIRATLRAGLTPETMRRFVEQLDWIPAGVLV